MPYALCPMPYARRVPHLSEKGYTLSPQSICQSDTYDCHTNLLSLEVHS